MSRPNKYDNEEVRLSVYAASMKPERPERFAQEMHMELFFIFHSAIRSSILIPSSALFCLFPHARTHTHKRTHALAHPHAQLFL